MGAARRRQQAQQPEQGGNAIDDAAGGALGTELVLTLERRGSGWGEEIFPRIALEQRPILAKAPRVRNRSSMPDPWAVSPPRGLRPRVLVPAPAAWSRTARAVVDGRLTGDGRGWSRPWADWDRFM